MRQCGSSRSQRVPEGSVSRSGWPPRTSAYAGLTVSSAERAAAAHSSSTASAVRHILCPTVRAGSALCSAASQGEHMYE